MKNNQNKTFNGPQPTTLADFCSFPAENNNVPGANHRRLTFSDELKACVKNADKGNSHSMAEALMELADSRIVDETVLIEISQVLHKREIPHTARVAFFTKLQKAVEEGNTVLVNRVAREFAQLPTVKFAIDHLHLD